jgi:hypothetical protein
MEVARALLIEADQSGKNRDLNLAYRQLNQALENDDLLVEQRVKPRHAAPHFSPQLSTEACNERETQNPAAPLIRSRRRRAREAKVETSARAPLLS